jgi:hypothetical protein
MAVAAPGTSQQATLSPAETAAFPNQIARCKMGDKEACRAALASPLLTESGRTEIEAAAALPTTAATPVYLLFPFECVIENGKPIFKPSSEPYFHEALDYRPASSYAVCGPDKGGWVHSLFSTCNMIELTSLRLVCKDGIARTPELTAANTTPFAKASRIDGDSLLVPIFNQWRSADVPEAYHRAPAGWGLVPHPNAVANLSSLESFFGPKRISVSGTPAQELPQTLFVMLDNWFPLPQIALLVLFLAAAGASTFGFSLYPNSRLSPRRPIFWIWLMIASLEHRAFNRTHIRRR